MAYDDEMVARFRAALSGYDNISEKKMMGGICFFHQGNMLGGCSGQKREDKNYMFRVGKDNEPEALKREGARPVILGDRRMGGMVFVEEWACDDAAMKAWITLVFDFAGTLPAKG